MSHEPLTPNTTLRTFLPKYAAEILAHASRHDYPKLIQEAASYLVRTDAAEVIEHLPSSYVVSWVSWISAIPNDLAR